MPHDLLPRSPWRFPSLFDEEDWVTIEGPSGLQISEDEEHLYVEAAVPGVSADDIDVTYHEGSLWIRASREATEEDKKKKYYRRDSRAYNYRVEIPGNIDDAHDPEVTHVHGVVTVAFTKVAEKQPRKLSIKNG